MPISINGRYLLAPKTGVQRYADEVLSRLPDLGRVIHSPKFSRGVAGHLWEQTRLPSLARNTLLWSPCNTGPLAVRNQVVTIHDCAVFDAPESFAPLFLAWYRFLLPRLAKRVRAVFTVSEFSRQRIIEVLAVAPTKVKVIPNGVGKQFSPRNVSEIAAMRKTFSLPSDYLLAVGSLEPRKNLGRLVQAYSKVKKNVGDISLVIVGGTAAAFADAGLPIQAEGVRILGFVGEEWLPHLYSGAQAFVYPSLYEGFGLPPLEAMACGTPVVCSNSTALPEVLGNAAVLVNSLRVDSITEGIAMILDQPQLRERLRHEGREHAKRFTWEITAQAISRELHLLEGSS